MPPEQWTLFGMIGAIATAGLAKLWVFGWTYADKVKDLSEMTVDRNFWRDTALQAMGHADKALGVAEKKAYRE